MSKYYSTIFIFLIGALSSIFFNKYWNYTLYVDDQTRHLIVRRPFSIIDFDDHEYVDSNEDAHELIIRETDVDVVCMLK
jgi:hypothetical protein